MYVKIGVSNYNVASNGTKKKNISTQNVKGERVRMESPELSS